MESWGRWTLETSLSAGLIGILLLLAARLLRPAPKPRSVLLALGMIPFVMPPLAELALSDLPLLSALGSPLESGTSGAAGNGAGTVLVILALAQWTGLAVGVAILGRSALQIRRILRDGERVESGAVWEAARTVATGMGVPVPDVYVIGGRTTAATGLVKGAILLPRPTAEGLDPAGLRMILTHETAHLARRDPLGAALRHLWVALWWFHPVAWALARGHRAATEDACDDVVVSREEGDPEAYCRTLLAWAVQVRGVGHDTSVEPPLPLANSLGSHPLERRMRRLLARDGHRGGRVSGRHEAGWQFRARRGVGTAFLVVALCLLPLRAVSWRGGADTVVGAVQTEEVVVRSTRIVVR